MVLFQAMQESFKDLFGLQSNTLCLYAIFQEYVPSSWPAYAWFPPTVIAGSRLFLSVSN